MWTDEKGALEQADAHIFELLKISSLRPAGRLYTRTTSGERWSSGLSKNLLDVSYRGWRPSLLCRLRWVETDGYAAGWEFMEPESMPVGWQGAPDAEPVEGAEDLQWLAEEIEKEINKELKQDMNKRVAVTDFIKYPLESSRTTNVYEGLVWEAIPREEIALKLDADTGTLMGWRHEGWFHEGPERSNPLSPQELQQRVESLPLFPAGMKFKEGDASADRAWHQEMTWSRTFEDELVENDFVYASVNRFTGQVADVVFNQSILKQELDLEGEQAAELFEGAFAQEFPDAIRCGMLTRMYVEISGQQE